MGFTRHIYEVPTSTGDTLYLSWTNDHGEITEEWRDSDGNPVDKGATLPDDFDPSQGQDY